MYNISRTWVNVLLSGVVYLSGLMRFRDGSDKGSASNVVQISEKVGRRPWQWWDKRSGKKAWTLHWKYKLTEIEKGKTGEEQSHDHARNFHWHQWGFSRRIRPGRPNSQFRILLWHCVKMCEDFAPNFNGKITGCCITTTHRLILPFSKGNFWPKTTWLSSPTHPTFLFSPIEDKTWRPPFWHNLGDRGRIAGGAEHPRRTRLPGCI
jgi:hypothetical protein